ncbi:sterol desaturase family protein [Tolypothrix sp. NIES-4075]|uniref:sterol desaturase family protein n=1 Tax=Tolypothrix sp. NIES-4075 TaxID=2005459 RepID=UPI000B5C61F1|nr:sterol desaturase family protein [Tolypothrix sp. NIES-4075]
MDWQSLTVVSSVISFGILENLFPFFSFKESFDKRVYPNLVLGLINVLANNFTIALLLNCIWQQTSWLGIFHLIHSPFLKIILSFLLLDGYMYVWHRLMHTLPIAWRFHKVHHTELLMNTSTAYRFHPVEAILANLPKLFLIWLFGINLQNLLLYEIFLACELIFHHSNWAMPLKIDRYLSYLIVTPNYHRSHHSQSRKEATSNYASFLTIWDTIFNSYNYPQNPKAIKLGLPQEKKELSIINLLKLPF